MGRHLLKSFLADVWRFTFGRGSQNPIYQHEVKGWSYMRLWAGLRRGCLPLLGILLLVGLMCGGSVALLLLNNAPDWNGIVAILIGALIGLMAAGEMVRWGTGLLATLLSSTTISAEVEAQTFGLLRLTDLSAREIVLAKFGATFRQFWLPLLTVAGVRILSVLGLGLTLGLVALNDPSVATAASGAVESTVPALQSAAVVGVTIVVIIAVMVWLLYYFTVPILRTFTFATLGIFASSLAKTRSGGLTLALAIRVGLWVLTYTASQIASVMVSLFTTPLILQGSNPTFNFNLDPLTTVLSGALISLISAVVLVVVQVILGLVALRLTVRRAERLPQT